MVLCWWLSTLATPPTLQNLFTGTFDYWWDENMETNFRCSMIAISLMSPMYFHRYFDSRGFISPVSDNGSQCTRVLRVFQIYIYDMQLIHRTIIKLIGYTQLGELLACHKRSGSITIKKISKYYLYEWFFLTSTEKQQRGFNNILEIFHCKIQALY